MEATTQENVIKFSKLEIIHHSVLIIFFFMLSFAATIFIWGCIESVTGFESKIVGDVFYFINLGFICLATTRYFQFFKLKLKYIGILFVLLLFVIPIAINYVIKIII